MNLTSTELVRKSVAIASFFGNEVIQLERHIFPQTIDFARSRLHPRKTEFPIY